MLCLKVCHPCYISYVEAGMKNIGVYVPKWLYNSAKTERLFTEELIKTIKDSGKYRPFLLDISTLSLKNPAATKKYCQKNNLALVIHHNSPFYSDSKRYMNNVLLLSEQLPLLNAHAVHKIAYHKIYTKDLLKQNEISVLDHTLISDVNELHVNMREGQWYVAEPADKGAGAGVKLIKKENGLLFELSNGRWQQIKVLSKKENTITLKKISNMPSIFSAYTYRPMMLEPYFNDDPDGFASLRCTVVGDEILETIKRINPLKITSNVVTGGKVIKVELNPEQKEMVLKTALVMSLDYAGIDLLVCGDKSVIGEVNIGPFTVFSAYTGSHVGQKLAEYAMRKADEAGRPDEVE